MNQSPTLETDASAVSSGEPAPLENGSTTTFVFSNLVFRAPGACFVGQGAERTPMFAVDLGETRGLLTIQGLKRKFNIAPGCSDDQMIDMAVRSLKYVAEIAPGDNIPNEILNGTASWTISPGHKEAARKKLELQLLASVDGKQVTLHDTREIAAYLENAENKPKLRKAFQQAAKALGRAEDDHTYVLLQLSTIARELSYIEALREWFLQVGSLHKKVQILIRFYDNDKRLKGEFNQMRPLLVTAIREYQAIFAAVDAGSSDVIAALTTIDDKVSFIRAHRDQLHHLTLIWSDTVASWKNFTVSSAPRYTTAAQETYRFLASRHSSGKSMLSKMGKPAVMVKAAQIKKTG